MKRMDFTDFAEIENYLLSQIRSESKSNGKLLYYGLIRVSKAKLPEICEQILQVEDIALSLHVARALIVRGDPKGYQ
jgi:hypothetical protein